MIVAVLASAAALLGADDVEKLGWMAGTWVEQKAGSTVRETWLAPIDGVMGGVGQTNRPGKTPFVEHMKISAESAGATFTAFFPGQPPTPFVLIPGPVGEATFENKANDYPQRVTYRRCGADLCARIEGTVGGKLQSQDWQYTRVK